MDRRVRRTHRLLKESLLTLMKERPFSEITVADIAERADVNRATFYLHFSNPAQLLESVGDDLLDQMLQLIDAHREELVVKNTLRPFLEQLLDAALESKELCALLFAHEQESRFAEKLLRLIQQRGEELIRAISNSRDEQEIPYAVNYISWGLIGLLRTWFRMDMELPREKLLDAAQALTDGAAVFYIRTTKEA